MKYFDKLRTVVRNPYNSYASYYETLGVSASEDF
jgi:hypothetical protein